jgi:ribosomal protein L37E
MGRRVSAKIRPLFSYPPVGLGKLGKRIVETEAVCSRCGNMSWAPEAERKSKAAACAMLRLSCPNSVRSPLPRNR